MTDDELESAIALVLTSMVHQPYAGRHDAFIALSLECRRARAAEMAANDAITAMAEEVLVMRRHFADACIDSDVLALASRRGRDASLYLLIQSGVYRHHVLGITADLSEAESRAKEFVLMEGDHYHDVIIIETKMGVWSVRLAGVDGDPRHDRVGGDAGRVVATAKWEKDRVVFL